MMIKLDHDWIRQTVSVETATHTMDIFKDKDIKYSLDDNFRVLKYGTCVADVNTCKLTGRGIYNVDLVDFINLL